MKENIQKIEIPHCIAPQCNGLVKPDIVFFGESLPVRFFQQMAKIEEADLVIVMGTSLQVMPFAALPHRAKEETPRVLINREKVGGIGSRRDDVLMLENCDAGVRRLAMFLGMLDELEVLWAKTERAKPSEAVRKQQDPYDGLLDMDEVLKAQVDSLSRDVEKGLKLADKHRHSVSEQLKVDQERRETLPTKKQFSQEEGRDSNQLFLDPGSQLEDTAEITATSLTESVTDSAATADDNGSETGKEKAAEEGTKVSTEPVSRKKTTHDEHTPSSNL